MSEETCKPKRNWPVTLLTMAIACCLIVQARLILKTNKLEKRLQAVEGMFAK